MWVSRQLKKPDRCLKWENPFILGALAQVLKKQDAQTDELLQKTQARDCELLALLTSLCSLPFKKKEL